eukprot:TRINITY_DN66_c0_g1_i2.p1 TRINITY_DN66_c0_g1~~TRINITY_DN66_c0_g1_i2.p1  ORF type:complete len:574 (-),score=169.11 TRINITY_DN66_c0_g1_i2:126-1847(-)
MTTTTKTILHCLFDTAKRLGNKATAYCYRKPGGSDADWIRVSWEEYARQIVAATKSLITLGFQPGQTVCILSISRPEWTILDVAAMTAGGAPAGIYPTSSPSEVAYIVNHSEAAIVCVENEEQFDKVRSEQQKGNLPRVKHVIILQTASQQAPQGAMTWDQFMSKGSNVDDKTVQERLKLLTEDTLATFIYTSGTTGPPKGVMLSHKNLYHAVHILKDGLLKNISENDRSVSFLPLSHIAEQLCTILNPAVTGSTVYYAESLALLPKNLVQVQPSIFFAPPRFWEKFHSVLRSKIPEGVTGNMIPENKKAEMRKAIGMGELKTAITGAAPSSVTVLNFFRDFVGITIYEVFGQSESTGIATFNYDGHCKFGTVGPAVRGVDVVLDPEDSEILMRGPIVSLGYYKDNKNTVETFTKKSDGSVWLHTGDLGSFDSEGYLSIIGRKKDIVITAGGENIAAPRIEKSIETHPAIQNAVVIGDKRPYLVALITLDPDVVTDIAGYINSEKGQTEIRNHINTVNSGLARVSTVKTFKILPAPFSIQTGELTPTMKVKRAFVNQKYAAVIDQIYQTPAKL